MVTGQPGSVLVRFRRFNQTIQANGKTLNTYTRGSAQSTPIHAWTRCTTTIIHTPHWSCSAWSSAPLMYWFRIRTPCVGTAQSMTHNGDQGEGLLLLVMMMLVIINRMNNKTMADQSIHTQTHTTAQANQTVNQDKMIPYLPPTAQSLQGEL